MVSGNFLEIYDFMVCGCYVAAIARTYFPGPDAYASLLVLSARWVQDSSAGVELGCVSAHLSEIAMPGLAASMVRGSR